jgi:O-antigen/teichoic acid export membrane protein
VKILKELKARKSAVVFTGGSLFKTSVQILANFFVLSYIRPEKMGIWNSVILFQTYALFFQAGTVNGLNRELPYEFGRNNDSAARELARTAQSFSIFSILLGLVAGIIVLFSLDSADPLIRISLIAVVCLTVFKFYEDYLTSTFRSSQSFIHLGWIYVFRGLLGLATLPLIIFMEFNGYLIRIILVSALMLLALHLYRPVKPGFGLSLKVLKRILATGIPIFILGYLFNSSATFDRVWLLKYEGTEMVGFYTLALLVYGAFQTLPLALANYIYPRFSFDVGRSTDKGILWKKAGRVNALMFLIMLPVGITGYFLIPFLVSEFFPAYTPGIRASQIILFASVFSGSSIGVNLLWSMKAWKWMTLIQLSGALSYVLLTLLCIRTFSDPLIGAACGVLFARIYYFLLTNYLTWYETHK